jgi:hypothetical protein
LPAPVESFEYLVEFSLIAGDLVHEVGSHLWRRNAGRLLGNEVEEEVGIIVE